MKIMKKIFAVVLAMVTMFSMSVTALAAAAGNDGSITVKNATKGSDYEIYKVFDLTYAASADKTNVAYTYTKAGDPDELYNALTAADSPFTLSQSTEDGKYNVTLNPAANEKTIADFFSGLKGASVITNYDVKTAESNEVVFDNLPYGYYFVTSKLGTVLTIDSTLKDVKILDKNQTPGFDPEDPTDPNTPGNPDKPDNYDDTKNGKYVSDQPTDGTYKKDNVAAIGDTSYFKINAYATKYVGDKKAAAYTFTDTLTDGFTFNNDLTVELRDPATDNVLATVPADKYTLTQDGQKLTLVVNVGDIEDYPTEARLTVKYSALVDQDAVYENANSVDLKWDVYPNNPDGTPNDGSKDDSTPTKPDPTDPTKEVPDKGNPYDPNDPEDPYNPENPTIPGNTPENPTPDPIPNPNADPTITKPDDPNVPNPQNPQTSTTTTYVLGFNLMKIEKGKNGEALQGAEFNLYTAENGGNPIEFVKDENGIYHVADQEQIVAGNTTRIIEAGEAKIFGLDETTYYLEETKAPAGYNALEQRQAITLANDDMIEENGLAFKAGIEQIINDVNSELPGTGGIGTTIFYASGAAVVLAGFVVMFIAKRRTSVSEA